MKERGRDHNARHDPVEEFCERYALPADARRRLDLLVDQLSRPLGEIGLPPRLSESREAWTAGPLLDPTGAQRRLLGAEMDARTRSLEAAWSASGSLPTMYSSLDRSGGEGGGREEDAEAALSSVRGPESGAEARYVDLGEIGRGGMGEVRRVQDRDLNRVLAMKVILPEALHNATLVSRFIQEAQVIAQLDHPGIVPAYELGRLPDGRLYFTMKEVKGRTLTSVIHDVHQASVRGRWRTGRSGWSFWKLIDAFCTVCKAVAYAHACGVVHRDLKPGNIMVGAFGEVLVMDWGLAKVTGQRDLVAEAAAAPALSVRRPVGDSRETLVGSVSGTPAYMPPEQARGEIERVGPPSDVYALGAILYEVLTGLPPFRGDDVAEILARVLAGPPPPPPRVVRGGSRALSSDSAASAWPPVPEALWEICQRAMSARMEDRYPHAGVLAEEVRAWLEGDKERGRAREIVARAEALLPGIASLRAEVEAMRQRASAVLAPVKASDPVEVKRPGWALLDQANRLERDADLREIEHIQLLRAALAQVPDLPEAHARLAEHYRARHGEAEGRRDLLEAARLEAMLRAHDDGRHAAYLQGDGAITLLTEPTKANVLLYRYVEQDRRLIPVFERVLGTTPLVNVPLARGSYLLVVRGEGCAEVRYPVWFGRQEHWDGVPPGGREPAPLLLPRLGSLDPGDIFVPGGWFQAGGDPDVTDNPGRRVWVPSFVMRRFPVTNREYVAFLDDLVAAGREEDALRWVPRERAGAADEQGALLYGRDDRGRFQLIADSDGDIWKPDWPVVNISWACAMAYARWLSERTGRAWRLPRELEWEKAARGVDGRFYPWGDFLDPTWCRMRDSLGSRPLPEVVDSYPVDDSPYGVRGLAGNVRDWCLDAWRPAHPEAHGQMAAIHPLAEGARSADMRSFRGGAWNNPASACRSAYRSAFRSHFRYPILGFRLCRSL